MPILANLLNGVKIVSFNGSLENSVKNIQVDSSRIEAGDLFIAICGVNNDGHSFISHAIERGARAVCLENKSFLLENSDVVQIVVKDTRSALATIASNFYSNPASKLDLIGITGTNGKTTTSLLIKSILEENGQKSGLLGTLAYKIGQETLGKGLTTPAPLKLYALFNKMVYKGVNSCVMEVSSHSLKQDRVKGLNFNCAVFTNITQDHLDYHKNFHDYFESKAKLFSQLSVKNGCAVLNKDDSCFSRLMDKNNAVKILSYSLKDPNADIYAHDIFFDSTFTRFNVLTPVGSFNIKTKLSGDYNIENILAAVGVGIHSGIDTNIISKGIEQVTSIDGRLESLNFGQKFKVMIDFAHTPDALQNVLKILNQRKSGRIITVFGCGGNRDRSKRPLMGKIATDLSFYTIVTSDNPRDEEPDVIIDEIVAGIGNKKNWKKMIERGKAIEYALSMAHPGDTVLIAGKGHEHFQEIKGMHYPFDDREHVRNYFGQK